MASLPFCQLSTADTLVCTSRSMRVILCALLVSVRTRHQREGYKKIMNNNMRWTLDVGLVSSWFSFQMQSFGSKMHNKVTSTRTQNDSRLLRFLPPPFPSPPDHPPPSPLLLFPSPLHLVVAHGVELLDDGVGEGGERPLQRGEQRRSTRSRGWKKDEARCSTTRFFGATREREQRRVTVGGSRNATAGVASPPSPLPSHPRFPPAGDLGAEELKRLRALLLELRLGLILFVQRLHRAAQLVDDAPHDGLDVVMRVTL